MTTPERPTQVAYWVIFLASALDDETQTAAIAADVQRQLRHRARDAGAYGVVESPRLSVRPETDEQLVARQADADGHADDLGAKRVTLSRTATMLGEAVLDWTPRCSNCQGTDFDPGWLALDPDLPRVAVCEMCKWALLTGDEEMLRDLARHPAVRVPRPTPSTRRGS